MDGYDWNPERTRKAEEAGGNRFFADVADTLREDFMDEFQMFYRQGVKAQWDVSENIHTKETVPILRVFTDESMACETGGVVIAPSKVAGISALQILVSNRGADYRVELVADSVSVFRALEIARAICVARFAVENRRD